MYTSHLAVEEHKAIDKSSEVPTALPLKWLTEKPIWVKQWPLAEEKLQALQAGTRAIRCWTYRRIYQPLELSCVCC